MQFTAKWVEVEDMLNEGKMQNTPYVVFKIIG